MYIDSHAHLEGPKFDADRAEMLARAHEAGLERILAIGSGTGPGTFDCAIRVAQQHDWIYATLGIHPHEAKLGTDADFAEMERLAKIPRLSPGVKSAWIIFTTTRRATCRKKFSVAKWRKLRPPGCPSSFTAAPATPARTPGTTRSRCCASIGPPQGCRAFCIASPESGVTHRRRWTSASTFPSLETSAFPRRRTFATPQRQFPSTAC